MATTRPTNQPESTSDPAYAERLQRLSGRGGVARRLIDPQRPYRWNLRRLQPGFVLDVGCGIGRNLKHLDGNGVGVDHNPDCVAACRADGLVAFTPDEFAASEYAVPHRFDSVLFAHVLEHMTIDEAVELVGANVKFVRRGGRVLVITPQERGQRSDSTHVTFIDRGAIRRIASKLNMEVTSVASFPFTRQVGRVFTYNETVSVLRCSKAV